MFSADDPKPDNTPPAEPRPAPGDSGGEILKEGIPPGSPKPQTGK